MKRQSNPERTALICATDLLARQDHSETRLRQKLTVRKYPQEEINEAIAKLKKYNYLNDERACSNQFDLMYQSERYSVRQICAKLLTLGFTEELIDKCKPENCDEHEELTAVRLLKMKFKKPTDTRKMQQFLYTRGFDYSIITSAVDKFKIDFENDLVEDRSDLIVDS